MNEQPELASLRAKHAATQALLADWMRRAAFFIGKRDRLNVAEQEIYCDCIADLRRALATEAS